MTNSRYSRASFVDHLVILSLGHIPNWNLSLLAHRTSGVCLVFLDQHEDIS